MSVLNTDSPTTTPELARPTAPSHPAPLPTRTVADVRAALLARVEIALLDVRGEAAYATGHPLWAANLAASRLELDAWGRLPRRDVPIVVYDDGEGVAAPSARKLQALGYTDVALLAGGLDAWREAGLELFRDVNVPSKAFGELVEARRHTPALSADEVRALVVKRADVVLLDARRFDEYRTMSLPGSISVPGGELVRRARDLAPDPRTTIVVHCAGRTRSLIGAQSLIDAGLPNPVYALRNGTIGWTLAGLALAHGQGRSHEDTPVGDLGAAREGATALARRARVRRIDDATLTEWLADSRRTTYRFDVRGATEYARGHRPGFRHAPGGQLVQETDLHAPVRGARLVLSDDDGIRAPLAAAWLAQMGWELAILPPDAATHTATGPDLPPQPESPPVATVTPARLAEWRAADTDREHPETVVIDVAPSITYLVRHIPGAWWSPRARLAEALRTVIPPSRRVVLTGNLGVLPRFVAADLAAELAAERRELLVLEGGTTAWFDAGHPIESANPRLAFPRDDRYRRPYEGTDHPHAAMQAYIDWEFGLLAQLDRDGTHFFRVIEED
ncbi:MAG: rhodanese-related sulfurtransferase [Mitsuaria chitosanitabida]|uniref:rhodanese-like domain-containing protein n=1 Tax=Roseateles chitosanitabidus TaxID=65048 RepID=UPI001B2DA869|nr:rhodanese-like domain-containing protein [Roseateles chitosanitabidus]MBO9686156.1 rhodanese-related sulfurtransferase [Roseateles chitosanitabidus]